MPKIIKYYHLPSFNAYFPEIRNRLAPLTPKRRGKTLLNKSVGNRGRGGFREAKEDISTAQTSEVQGGRLGSHFEKAAFEYRSPHNHHVSFRVILSN